MPSKLAAFVAAVPNETGAASRATATWENNCPNTRRCSSRARKPEVEVESSVQGLAHFWDRKIEAARKKQTRAALSPRRVSKRANVPAQNEPENSHRLSPPAITSVSDNNAAGSETSNALGNKFETDRSEAQPVSEESASSPGALEPPPSLRNEPQKVRKESEAKSETLASPTGEDPDVHGAPAQMTKVSSAPKVSSVYTVSGMVVVVLLCLVIYVNAVTETGKLACATDMCYRYCNSRPGGPFHSLVYDDGLGAKSLVVRCDGGRGPFWMADSDITHASLVQLFFQL